MARRRRKGKEAVTVSSSDPTFWRFDYDISGSGSGSYCRRDFSTEYDVVQGILVVLPLLHAMYYECPAGLGDVRQGSNLTLLHASPCYYYYTLQLDLSRARYVHVSALSHPSPLDIIHLHKVPPAFTTTSPFSLLLHDIRRQLSTRYSERSKPKYADRLSYTYMYSCAVGKFTISGIEYLCT